MKIVRGEFTYIFIKNNKIYKLLQIIILIEFLRFLKYNLKNTTWLCNQLFYSFIVYRRKILYSWTLENPMQTIPIFSSNLSRKIMRAIYDI